MSKVKSITIGSSTLPIMEGTKEAPVFTGFGTKVKKVAIGTQELGVKGMVITLPTEIELNDTETYELVNQVFDTMGISSPLQFRSLTAITLGGIKADARVSMLFQETPEALVKEYPLSSSKYFRFIEDRFEINYVIEKSELRDNLHILRESVGLTSIALQKDTESGSARPVQRADADALRVINAFNNHWVTISKIFEDQSDEDMAMVLVDQYWYKVGEEGMTQYSSSIQQSIAFRKSIEWNNLIGPAQEYAKLYSDRKSVLEKLHTFYYKCIVHKYCNDIEELELYAGANVSNIKSQMKALKAF